MTRSWQHQAWQYARALSEEDLRRALGLRRPPPVPPLGWIDLDDALRTVTVPVRGRFTPTTITLYGDVSEATVRRIEAANPGKLVVVWKSPS